MRSKTKDFSHEPYRENTLSYSVDDVANTVKRKRSKIGQHATSEASNLMNSDLSHDSFTENAQSKGHLRTSDAIKFVDPRVSEGHDDNISDDVQNSKVGFREENVQVESRNDVGDEALCEEQSREVENVGDFPSFPDEARAMDESDESDIVEHDVKVCDICGDAGLEDLLAICCRCSDGAEHTYCMRERMDKVPEGDWLCEECNSSEEIDTTRQDISCTEDRNEKGLPSGQEDAKLDVKVSDVEGNIPNKEPLCAKGSNKQMAMSLSRDSSSKNLDSGKVQTTGGGFLKSNSFNFSNAKSKVKLVDEVPRKYRSSKEGAAREIVKSLSFKSVNSTSLSMSESKVKMLSPKFSHVQDHKGAKHANEKNFFERKNSFKSPRPSNNPTMSGSTTISTPKGDPKFTSRGESVSWHRTNNTELKTIQSDSRSISTATATATDSSSVNKTSREEIHKGNQLKVAIEAAMLKKPSIYRSKLQNGTDTKPLMGETHNTSSGDGSSIMVPSDGKHYMELSSHASIAMSLLLQMSAIPDHEYVWQGSFNVHGGRKTPELWDGFQAHLSTCASPKVIAAVNKFPRRVLLNEVPRLSAWPAQFKEYGVGEGNIALYFFAREYESYDRSYKILLDRMMRSDLALRGNIDGVELLIFPSNQLPEKSQRWNMLYFFWGVFRGKKEICLQQGPVSPKKPDVPDESSSMMLVDINPDAKGETPSGACGSNTPMSDKVACNLLIPADRQPTSANNTGHFEWNNTPSLELALGGELKTSKMGEIDINLDVEPEPEPPEEELGTELKTSGLCNIDINLDVEAPEEEEVVEAEVKTSRVGKFDINLDEEPPEEEEEEALSLSLSFPIPEKEVAVLGNNNGNPEWSFLEASQTSRR